MDIHQIYSSRRLPNPGDDACLRDRETHPEQEEREQFTTRRHDLTHDNIEPRRPGGAGWTRTADQGAGIETWVNAAAGLVAVTDVVHTPVPSYRLGLRQHEGGRCCAAEVLLALFDFGLLEAQESDFTRHADTRVFICPIAS